MHAPVTSYHISNRWRSMLHESPVEGGHVAKIHVYRGCSDMGSLQFLYAGRRATLNIGNIKPVGDMPEGTIICNVEEVRALPAACQHAAGNMEGKI